MGKTIDRRKFLQIAGSGAAASMMAHPLMGVAMGGENDAKAGENARKKRFAIVGTGSRGTYWGRSLTREFGELAEIVAVADINPGRAGAGIRQMGATCPVYTDFEKMMAEVKPGYLIVTTVDATHDKFIIRAMELGCDIVTEKPMTTDEVKCQAILDAQKRTGRKIIVAFNYRYAPHRSKLWSLLRAGEIGEVTSVDFHWYLDTSHGADYFRRWHRRREFGGSLWLHKASHHFDLLNWWLDSEPEEVFAYGALEFYGRNGKLRATNCRTCPHTKECKFYWNIEASQSMRELYVNNEKYDGYLRDGCVFKEDVDIFDKMCASIKYANGVQVSYSLTTYSPYEGYRIAFNGTKGRIDLWVQESNPTYDAGYQEIVLTRNFSRREYIRVADGSGGHAGGDPLMMDMILTGREDNMKQSATLRQGALAILIGIAARKSCDTGKPVKIASLTDIVPQKNLL